LQGFGEEIIPFCFAFFGDGIAFNLIQFQLKLKTSGKKPEVVIL